MDGFWSEIRMGDGGFRAFMVTPPADPFPAVVLLLHDIFGLDHNTRSYAVNFAQHGFSVCCPDLYWRLSQGIQLSETYEDLREALRLQDRLNVDTAVADARLTLARIREANVRASGLVVGYGLGGLIATLMSADDEVRGIVAYYGTGLETRPEAVARGKRPLMFHVGEADFVLNANKRARIGELLARNREAKICTYPQIGHRFVSPDAVTYDRAATELADARTIEFLARICVSGRADSSCEA
jgi:carboxymethylenebutenolidase